MFEYMEIDSDNLDSIASLWNKLREHQRNLSPHFSDHYEQRNWKSRKTELLQKSESGGFHAVVAIDKKMKRIIGYCVSTISSDRQGCLESIYIEPEYRNSGIGDKLMRQALQWMDKKQAKTKTLTVGVGNERVLDFYSRYSFYPKHVTVEQVKYPKTARRAVK
jgi:ribosomal protein S18 acetylase RimI-like enzyme